MWLRAVVRRANVFDRVAIPLEELSERGAVGGRGVVTAVRDGIAEGQDAEGDVAADLGGERVARGG